MRHLFVVDSLDKHIQNEKELIRPRRLLPAARATRARSAQFYVVLIRHDSTGVGGLFCICVESINLNLNTQNPLSWGLAQVKITAPVRARGSRVM